MNKKILNILFSLIIPIAPIILAEPERDETCLHNADLDPTAPEEIDLFAGCLLNVLVQRGYKLCDSECMKKLTEEQVKEHYMNLARIASELLKEEAKRRKK